MSDEVLGSRTQEGMESWGRDLLTEFSSEREELAEMMRLTWQKVDERLCDGGLELIWQTPSGLFREVRRGEERVSLTRISE